MEEFRLHPQAASDRGWHFAMLASEISSITTWWESNMSVLGDYCGTDSAGQQFKATYQPKVDSVDQALLGIVQQLYGLGTTLDRLAQESAQGQAADAQALRTLTNGHPRGRHN